MLGGAHQGCRRIGSFVLSWTSVLRSVACRGLVMPGATAWLDAPYQILVLSSGVWWSLLLDTLFVTSQFWRHIHVCKPTFGGVCWHNMHIILYALSLLVVAQCVTVMNIHYQRSQVRRPEQNTALNAKTKQFINAKISGNPLKQETRTHSVLRHQGQFTTAKI